MRLLFWDVAALGGVGATALMPRSALLRESLVSEPIGKYGGPSVGEAGLPQSGGPDIFLPAAGVLLGASILMYALLRQQKRA